MAEDRDFILTNNKIIKQKISGIDYELLNCNINKYLEDLEDFIDLIATYPGDESQISEFIEKLIERVKKKSHLNHYDLFFYHLCVKLASYYSLSRNNIDLAIERLITAIRSYSIAYETEKLNLQIFMDILKLKIYALLQDDVDFKTHLIQEVDELFIQFLEKMSIDKDVFINGSKVKKNNFYEIKSNILEFSLILFLINQNNGNEAIYKRLEDIFIFFREKSFDVYVLGKALGTLILENTPG